LEVVVTEYFIGGTGEKYKKPLKRKFAPTLRNVTARAALLGAATLLSIRLPMFRRNSCLHLQNRTTSHPTFALGNTVSFAINI
jgi:hypothetical protein